MTHVLQAEWTKLRSLNSTAWALVAAAGLMVVFGILIAAGSETTGCPPDGCDDMVANSLGGIYVAQFAIVALAVMAITSEYATGLIRVTFVAMPRRRAVLVAKAAAVGVATLVVGLITAIASYQIGTALLEGNGYIPANGYPYRSLLDGEVMRAVGGTALYLVALAWFSLGLGAIVRNTAATITMLVALLWVPLIVGSLVPEKYADPILKFTPMTAGLAIQRTVPTKDPIHIGEWAGLGVAALWGLGAMAIALWLIGRRDA
jgi:ABC-2 type transport system permease protein